MVGGPGTAVPVVVRGNVGSSGVGLETRVDVWESRRGREDEDKEKMRRRGAVEEEEERQEEEQEEHEQKEQEQEQENAERRRHVPSSSCFRLGSSSQPSSRSSTFRPCCSIHSFQTFRS